MQVSYFDVLPGATSDSSIGWLPAYIRVANDSDLMLRVKIDAIRVTQFQRPELSDDLDLTG